MNKQFFTYIIAVFILIGLNATAQTNPGTASLTHQWTFDDGTATDIVGSANGSLQDAATISNKALNTSDGGYLSFSGSTIGINSYSELTTEVWFKSTTGLNSGNPMLIYFGDTNGTNGVNYIFTSPSNGGKCRLAISTGNTSQPWSAEDGVNRAAGAIDDGLLHHLVSVIDATNITFYVDGASVGTTGLTGTNSISTVSNANAFLCKSGYSGDPTWRGQVNKFSIYNKALSADEVLFLYQQGAESSTSINVSKSSLSFDELYTSDSFTVTGSNLSDSISITAPTGITVSPDILDSVASNVTVNVTYDGTSVIDDNITLTSGSEVLDIPVKASPNASCFTPLYTDIPNLIADPLMNTITDSWGNVSVITGSDVDCGSHCVKITGSDICYPNGGSITTGSITWLPFVTYRFHARVRTMDGTFNMGVQNANIDGASGDYNIKVPNTNGVWTDYDATFTAGASPTSGVAFFNNCGASTGKVAYIDNWELYALPGISTSTSSIYLDDYANSASFKVTGVNLSESITLSVSDGLELDQTALASDAVGVTVNVTSTNTDPLTGTITLTSGTSTQNISVTVYNNSECYTPLYPDATNLITDPCLNDLSNFSGSGTRSINTDPAHSYCGIRSGEITSNGTIQKDLTGVMKPNTTYRIKAKVFRKYPGNVTYNLNVDKDAYPTEYQLIKTAMDSACSLFNQYTPFSADIYVYMSSGIPTAQASYHGSIGFGSNTWYMWVGTAIHEMDHYFGSGTSNEWWNHMVNGSWTGTVANNLMQTIEGVNISGDSQHFWPCGINQRTEITNLGGLAAQYQGLIDAVKVAKAMLVDDCGLATNKAPVGIGVYGWDSSSDDIYQEVTTMNSWQDVDFTFTTGATLKLTQKVYFNAGPGYIDNWEMYEVPVTSIDKNELSLKNQNVYLSDNTLVTEYELTKGSNVEISVFDVQGKLLFKKSEYSEPGIHKDEFNVNLSGGIYIVKMASDEFIVSKKLIK